MVCVLAFVSRLALLLTRQPRSPDELRRPRIFEIEDLNHDVPEAGLSGSRIEVAGFRRPPAFVRAHDERPATARTARAGRRAGDLRDERDPRRVGRSRRDVEDLVLEILPGLPF